jgi:hypothetical protein
MKKLIIILAITLLNSNIEAQRNEDLRYASMNMLSNGIISGIGSSIHHKNNESLGKAFINGFWKGCLGGGLNYSAMKLVQKSAFNNNLNYVWPSRFVNSLGSSIVMNGIENKGVLSSVSMNLYFLNLMYDGKIHYKVDVLTLGYAGYLSVRKDMNFNVKTSILTGSILFDQNSDKEKAQLLGKCGKSLGNTMYVNHTKKSTIVACTQELTIGTTKMLAPSTKESITDFSNSIICHEIIHTFQYTQSYSLNSLITNNLYNKIKINTNKVYINLNFGLLYLISNSNGYHNNYFENEADYYGNSNF